MVCKITNTSLVDFAIVISSSEPGIRLMLCLGAEIYNPLCMEVAAMASRLSHMSESSTHLLNLITLTFVVFRTHEIFRQAISS